MAQVWQFSPNFAWHAPLPQHCPQSPGHIAQVSNGSQVPLPQVGGQGPQSAGQAVHDSPYRGSQVPLPQVGGQGPQSMGHAAHVSDGSQMPLPQVGGHGPQSMGQDLQLSLGSHFPLPHPGHWPQS
jgi:hypothetical protein